METESSTSGKLKQLVDHACERFNFYREKYNRAGLSPKSFRGSEDLLELPFTTKSEFLAHSLTDEFLQSLLGELYYIGFTTGTTSVPMPIFCTHEDWGAWERNLAIGFQTAGMTKQDIVQITLGRWGIGSEVVLGGIRRLGGAGLPIEVDTWQMDDYPNNMTRFHVSCLFTYPSIARSLCQVVEDSGHVTPSYLKKVVLVGEAWSEDFRKMVSNTLGVEVYDFYGSTEAGMIGAECSSHDGLHFSPDQVLLEIVDLTSTRPMPDGEDGEVVVTTLWRKGLPLIRYRTGDITSKLEGQCRCGSDKPRIARVKGRIADLVQIGSTKIHPYLIERAITDVLGSLYNYQIVVSNSGNKEKMSVVIEVPQRIISDRNLSDSLGRRLHNLQEDFASLVDAGAILPPETMFVAIDSIQRKGGKIPRLRDERNK